MPPAGTVVRSTRRIRYCGFPCPAPTRQRRGYLAGAARQRQGRGDRNVGAAFVVLGALYCLAVGIVRHGGVSPLYRCGGIAAVLPEVGRRRSCTQCSRRGGLVGKIFLG